MKPPAIALDDITALPQVYRLTIPETFRDENGHMNMRWYLHVYDDAGYPLAERFGLTPEFHVAHGTGGFDLEHHIHYLREIHPGDTVSVYVRLVGRSAKRLHYLMFLVNETRGSLASIFECVNSFADLRERRTAPYPAEVAARIDALLDEQRQLGWPAPVCGIMGA